MIDNIIFEECEMAASLEDVAALEADLGIRLPESIRWIFLNANGGRPNPSVFPNLTDVSECLALREGRGSVRRAYVELIQEKKVAPPGYFPFAHDSGGNVFMIDCSDPAYRVYLLTHEGEFRLVDVRVGLDSFWAKLTTLAMAYPGRAEDDLPSDR